MRALLRRIARRVLRTYSAESARARTESRSRSTAGSQTPEPRISSAAPSLINESVLSDDYYTADEVSFEIERDNRKCSNRKAVSPSQPSTPGKIKVTSKKKKARQCDKTTTGAELPIDAMNKPVSSQEVNVTSKSKKTTAQNTNERLPATQPESLEKVPVADVTSKSKSTVAQRTNEIPSELSPKKVISNEVASKLRKIVPQNSSETHVLPANQQPAYNVASRPRKVTVEQNNTMTRTSELPSTPKDSPAKPKRNDGTPTLNKKGSENKLPICNQPAISLTKVAPTKVISRKRPPQITSTPTTVERKDTTNKAPLQQNPRSLSTPNASTETIRTKKPAQNNSTSAAEKTQSHNYKPATVAASQSCPTTAQSSVAVKIAQKKKAAENDKAAHVDKTAAEVNSDFPVIQISTKEEKSPDDSPPTPVVSIVAGHQMGCTGWQLIDEQIPSTAFYRQVAKVHAQSVRKLHKYQQTKVQVVNKTLTNAELLKKKRIAASNKRRKQVRKVSTKK